MASIWRWYLARLSAKPLPTKMVTSAVILGSGDVTAQLILAEKEWDARRFVPHTPKHAPIFLFLASLLWNNIHHTINFHVL